MPTPTTSKLPKPKSWEEFEDIVTDIMKDLWQDLYIKRNGRQGQKQNGVDICGLPRDGCGYHGVQCKNTESLTFKEIEAEVSKAENFEPPLVAYIIATTVSREARLEEDVRKLCSKRREGEKFSVRIMFWEDICLELSENRVLLQKHFPGWIDISNSASSIYSTIGNSVPSDWIYHDPTRIYTYRNNVELNIKRMEKDRTNNFPEPWAKKFPDPSASTVRFTICYGTSSIGDVYTALIDGGRCYIPYPKSRNNLTITPWECCFGRIVNISNGGFQDDYDCYLGRAVITIWIAPNSFL